MNRKQKKKRLTKTNTVSTSNPINIRRLVAAIVLGLILISGWLAIPLLQVSSAVPPELDMSEETDAAILDALKSARSMVEKNLDSHADWGQFGLVLSAHGFSDKAAECFLQASKLAPQNQRWAYLYARLKAETDPEESILLLEKCAEMGGDPSETPRLVLVEKLLETHQLEKAESHLDWVLAGNPQNARARFAKARLHFMRNEFEECKDLIVTTNRRIKDAYQADIQRAKQLIANGRQRDAKTIVDEANQKLQASLCQQKTIGTMLAAAYWRLGDSDAGRSQQNLANQQSDTNWPDPYVRGISELKTGLRSMLSNADIAHSEKRFTDAVEILTQAVSQYPDSLFARIQLARNQIRLGRISQQSKNEDEAIERYQAAEQQLNAALRLDANSVEAYFRKGVLNLYWAGLSTKANPLSDAEACFRKAISIKPDFHMAYFNLARCLDKQRRQAEAVSAMRETLKFDPNYLPARRALGGLLMKAGKLEEAIVELDQVLKSSPHDKQVQRWVEMMRRDLRSR